MRTARFGGILIAALILAALATRPARAADEAESLKGDEKELGDVKFCRLELPAKDLIFPLIWASRNGRPLWSPAHTPRVWATTRPAATFTRRMLKTP